ncbi:MAG: molecular chaperone HtpG [Bacillales bacterium]|nr:molecular chaperone HtpG [Bacillales bacterium]
MKETLQFQTESKELLNLMINSIYSNKEIFLRELISNASDAIDKYKFLAFNSNGTIPFKEGEIHLSYDETNHTITISDNGIGMSKEDIINNLGTIAKSGSKDFMNKFKEAKEKQDINIIGQFGVGFYSAFMVADKVEVLTKANNEPSYLFSSNGKDNFTIEEKEKDDVGTIITLYLKEDIEDENYSQFASRWKIEELVKKYSDYVRYPIKMTIVNKVLKKDENGKEIENEYENVYEEKTLNSMIPLWKKNKSEVEEKDLNEFYKAKFNDFEDPLFSLFVKVDGVITYSSLLFIPSHAPYNLYSENYEKGLQLYAKNIFIKDKCPELVPDYLKFVRGLVDSDDFNLNISREILQSSPILKKIANNVEKKIIDELKKTKENDFEKYKKFWNIYGEHIKYGLYSSYGEKSDLLKDLLVFPSLNKENNDYISLKEYVDNMKENQKFIYFAAGDTIDSIKLLPQLEKYKKEEIDVLLLDKKIDEFTLMVLAKYMDKDFKSISDETLNEEINQEEKDKIDSLSVNHKRFLDNIKESLKDKVDNVVFSSKLIDSPVCISTKQGLSLNMERTLDEQKGFEDETPRAIKTLEINPDHDLFKALIKLENNDEDTKNYASILYDEALLLEGIEIKDKHDFVKKLNEVIVKSINK